MRPRCAAPRARPASRRPSRNYRLTQQRDHRPVRKTALVLVTTGGKHDGPTGAGLIRKLVHQTRLSDSRLTLDHRQGTVRPGAGVGGQERGQRFRPPDERQLGRRLDDPDAWRRSGKETSCGGARLPSFTCSYSFAVSSSGATPSSWLRVRTQCRYCSSAAARSPLHA